MHDALAARASKGSTPALLAAAATAGLRWLPGLENAHFPTLRWLIVHYLGDAVAYHSGTDGTGHYEQVQTVLARSLHELALKAGEDAPLAVLGHSLGSVVSSDFLYDLQGVAHGTPLYPGARAALDDTPIERGETFGWYYTLGSPLALWAQRHPDFGVPLTVPHPEFAEHHPDQRGEWVNVYDPDDVIASPLRPLSGAWAGAVREDRRGGGRARGGGGGPPAPPPHPDDPPPRAAAPPPPPTEPPAASCRRSPPSSPRPGTASELRSRARPVSLAAHSRVDEGPAHRRPGGVRRPHALPVGPGGGLSEDHRSLVLRGRPR